MSRFLQQLRGTDPRCRLALALDLPTASAAFDLIDRVGGDLKLVKVGLQLFTAEGPALLSRLRERGLEIFLDLKLHDIPNTMASAIRSMAEFDVALTTVHAAAGAKAIALTRRASDESQGPTVLAVSVLTSFDDPGFSEVLGRKSQVSIEVPRLARLSVEAGAHGVVASPHEIDALRETVGSDPLLVIPGIRPAGADLGDQSRVATPATALASGADLLVIGRPITQAPDPAEAVARILDEMRREG
jgi:orotidine-5'-phosphate decarboxylase